MRSLLLPLAFIASCAHAWAQQTTGAPPRDTSPPASKGTGIVRGTVVALDTGRPLRRARISISDTSLGTDSRRSTSTGLDGTYVFRDLPAARYRLTVIRGGYLQLEYGQRRPREQGRPLQLADGQTLEKVDFALPRMSGVSGRITDENGEPIEGVSVYAMRWLFFEGRRRLVPVSGTAVRTDDDGDYRVPRLPPGAYQLMATTKETWTVTDADGRETVSGYMPTYYPGVSDSTEARGVSVGVGEHVRAVDFQLVPGRAAKVAGTAIDSKGRPFSRVSLSEEVRGLGFASFGVGPGATVTADGTFTIRDVPPGEYTLQASRYGAEADGPPEAALMPVFVDGTDIENLVLVGSSGGTVTGKIVAEEGALPKTSDILITIGATYRNQPPPLLLSAFRENRGGPTVREDGTFTVHNVFGRARFHVTLPDGWMVKTIRHRGHDLASAVLELKSGEQLAGVEITISPHVTEIGGRVADGKNAPVAEATVLVFPADPDHWFERSQSVRATRPDQEGRWQIKGMPAGEYLAVALDFIEVDAWQDPEYLEALRRYAERVTIPERGKQSVALKVVVPKQ